MKMTFRSLLAIGLISVSSSILQAALVITPTLTQDNGNWPSLPIGYSLFDDGTKGHYDAFSLTIHGDPGEQITSASLTFRFRGLFDDSVAFDLNGDGTIDWVGDYFHLIASYSGGGAYTPWSNESDPLNTVVSLTIGQTGSSAQLYVYGQPITLGLSSNSDANLVNNLSNITLSNLGLPSVIPGTGNATTTTSIRIGFVNTSGAGFGYPAISSADFGISPAGVPEPSQVAASLLVLGGIGGYVYLKRRKAMKAVSRLNA